MLKVTLPANVKFYAPPLTSSQQEALARYRRKGQKQLAQRLARGRTCCCNNEAA